MASHAPEVHRCPPYALRAEMTDVWPHAGGIRRCARALSRFCSLRDDFFWLLASEESRRTCDVRVVAGAASFDVHTVVLKHRAPALLALLGSDGATSPSGDLPVIVFPLDADDGEAARVAKMFLGFAYCGTVGVRRTHTPAEANQVRAAAEALATPRFLEAYTAHSMVASLEGSSLCKGWRADVRRMFNDEACADVVLCAEQGGSEGGDGGGGTTRIHTHKALLAARSSHFSEMFTPGKWRDEAVVAIDPGAAGAGAVGGVFEYLATGEVEGHLSKDDPQLWQRLYALVEASRYFRMDDLFFKVEGFLSAMIDVDTVCPLWNMCSDMKAEHVAERCRDFVVQCFNEVSSHALFLDLRRQHVKEVLLTGNVKASMRAVIAAVKAWGLHNCAEPQPTPDELLQYIHDLLPPCTLCNAENKRWVMGLPPPSMMRVLTQENPVSVQA